MVHVTLSKATDTGYTRKSRLDKNFGRFRARSCTGRREVNLLRPCWPQMICVTTAPYRRSAVCTVGYHCRQSEPPRGQARPAMTLAGELQDLDAMTCIGSYQGCIPSHTQQAENTLAASRSNRSRTRFVKAFLAYRCSQ